MNITLLGYMGCGKTTIGKILSYKLNLKFYDLDNIIINHQNDTINNIFKKKGELYFRKIEKYLLKEFFLKNIKGYILSVGGGTPCSFNNIYIINKYSKTFYIKLDSFYLFKRLFLDKNNRPLISKLSKCELFKFIITNLYKRSIFYEKSFRIINANNKNKKYIVMNIIKEFNNFNQKSYL